MIRKNEPQGKILNPQSVRGTNGEENGRRKAIVLYQEVLYTL